MPKITSIQRREPRSNQYSDKYSNYDQSCEVNHLEISSYGNNMIKLFFAESGNKSLGVGLIMPKEIATLLAKMVDAVEPVSSRIEIALK